MVSVNMDPVYKERTSRVTLSVAQTNFGRDCRTTYRTSKQASKIQSILRNFETLPSKFRESSQIVAQIFAGMFARNFEISKILRQ